MSATTEDRPTAMRPAGRVGYPIAAAMVILAGTLVCLDSGELVDGEDTSGFVFVGVASDGYDNSDGAAGDLDGEVYSTGQFSFAGSGFAATDVGRRVYLSDNQTVTTTVTNVYVGRIVEFVSSTEVWVQLDACSAEAADTATLTAHLNGGASKHDATEIDYERVDGSKKNIQSGSDSVEAALTDLDDATGLLSGLTTTAKTSAVAAINEVDADLTALRRSTAIINNGASTVIVNVGAPYDGKPAFAQLNEADGSLHILHAVWNGSGDLTITLSGNATADRTVAWFVDGR